MFTINFINQDGSESFKDMNDLDSAQYEAATLSENGCHCISISDIDDNEYSF